MERHLRSYVHVHQDDGSTKVYGPGDEDSIPEADLKKIGDHCFLADGEEPAVDQPAGAVVREPDEEPAKPRRQRKTAE